MEAIFDSTLWTILVILLFATLLALIRAQKRDRCLTHFHRYHITLAEKDGRLTWGNVEIRTSGLEVLYPAPRQTEKGFWNQSVLFFKDQYPSMDGLYRTNGALDEKQRKRRFRYLRRTSRPGPFRRLYRKIRNWIGMVRDAVVQAASLLLGAARSRGAAAAVLTRDEERLNTLSKEIIGHAGNAFDPLLERHLFTRVIIDVTRQGRTFHYCGYLADYTSDFLEIIDAQVTSLEYAFGPELLPPDTDALEGLSITIEDGLLQVQNNSEVMLLIHELHRGKLVEPVGAVLPTGFRASFRIYADDDPAELALQIESARRIDMLLPRSHSLVRHGVSGLELTEIEALSKEGRIPRFRRKIWSKIDPF